MCYGAFIRQPPARDKPMSLIQDVTALSDVQPHLSARSQEFAASLISQFQRRGSLSDKQAYWVTKLAQEGTDRKNGTGQPQGKADAFPGIASVFAWFATAGSNLRYPKVVFHLEDGKALVLKVTKGGRHPGAITLADDGQYPNNEFYGWVKPDGTWIQSRNTDRNETIEAFLTGMSADPVGYVKAYGHKSGNCCFCTRPLTQEKSTAAGYGPVCAKKWGLPW